MTQEHSKSHADKSAHTTHVPHLTLGHFKPKHWPFWLGYVVFRLLVLLPLPILLQFGKYLGRVCYKYIKRRRVIAQRNIELCFPDKTKFEQQQMCVEIFENAGVGIMETLASWWVPSKFDGCIEYVGLENIQPLLDQNKPVMLLGQHNTVLDLGGLFLSKIVLIDAVYLPQRSVLADWAVFNGRKPFFNNQISAKGAIRGMINSLQNNKVIWYSPDQDFGLKYGVMSTFFGMPAATITANRDLLTKTGAQALAMHVYRTSKVKSFWQKPTYTMTFTPVLENYPSDNEQADADRVNKLLEELISKDVCQYMWFHRRFKTQPDGHDFYS